MGIEPPRPGRAYLMPWGEYLVFGPDGASVDVIAHELVHPEIVMRLGYLTYVGEVPVWFYEGAAMQVDYRRERVWSYIQEGIALPSVSTIASARSFFSGDRALHYAAAKVEIESWLAAEGNPGLYAFLSELRDERDFESLYDEFARNR